MMTTKIDLNKFAALQEGIDFWVEQTRKLPMSRLMNEHEQKEFRDSVRRNWEYESAPRLEASLKVNERLMQQVQIRQEVVKEMIDELKSGKRKLKPSPHRGM